MAKHAYYMIQRPFSIGAEPKLYFGYVRYADGSMMCHAKGTLAEVKASEERIKATSKVRVRGFKRNEVSREFFEAHTTENAATSEYNAARKATEAYAEFSGIGYEKHLTPQEAAQEIAGTAFRKYVEGQKIRTRWSYVRKEH